MMIRIGDWVRHGSSTMMVGRICDGRAWSVSGKYGWAVEECIPVHPPRDKKPPRKVTWAECEAWMKEQGLYSGPVYNVENACWTMFVGDYFSAKTRIGVVIAARKAMRGKKMGVTT